MCGWCLGKRFWLQAQFVRELFGRCGFHVNRSVWSRHCEYVRFFCLCVEQFEEYESEHYRHVDLICVRNIMCERELLSIYMVE